MVGLKACLVAQVGHEPHVLGSVKEYIEPIGIGRLQGAAFTGKAAAL